MSKEQNIQTDAITLAVGLLISALAGLFASQKIFYGVFFGVLLMGLNFYVLKKIIIALFASTSAQKKILLSILLLVKILFLFGASYLVLNLLAVDVLSFAISACLMVVLTGFFHSLVIDKQTT